MSATKIITLALVLSASQAVFGQNCGGWRNGELLANTADCSKYYVCNHGELVTFQCKSGLMYDHILRVCNWPQAVSCGQLSNPEHKPPAPVVPLPPMEPQHPLPPNYYPYPPMTPPQQPPQHQPTPMYPNYNGTYDEYYPGIMYNPSSPMQYQCSNPGFYFAPDKTNCQKYYICENFNIHAHQCGDGIHWDYIFAQCDYPARTFCYADSSNTGNPIHNIEDETTTIGVIGPIADNSDEVVTGLIPEPIPELDVEPVIICPEVQAFIAHPKDCHKYYICIGGIPIVTSCPDRMAWDKENVQCNEEAVLRCV